MMEIFKLEKEERYAISPARNNHHCLHLKVYYLSFYPM